MKGAILYYGNAEDILAPAEMLGWEFCEDRYIEEDGGINWDKAIEEAVDYLKKKGVTIEYS